MTSPGRILCIEDNPMNWRLVQRLLTQAGYEAHWAEDGMKGYEMAKALEPDLVLLDINLPGLSGFEVATKLRRDGGRPGMLIVALTARTMRSDREAALVTGCDGFIAKPIDPFLFVGQVEAYLGGQRDHLDAERESAALRQFSQQVVERLEAQLKQAQESNRKLLEAQAALEARNHALSRLLDLSRDLILLRDTTAMLQHTLQQLGEDLDLARLSLYKLHRSGGYLVGQTWSSGECREAPALPLDHPLVHRLAELPPGPPLTGEALARSAFLEPALAAGLWDPREEGLLLSMQDPSPVPGLVVFLAAGRSRPFLPFETELAALYSELLNVSLENADLIRNLDETSRALGSSYERLEAAYLDLQAAQRALGIQDRKAALGDLFLNMAQRLQAPAGVLRQEIRALAVFMDTPQAPMPEQRQECHRALGEIHQAIGQVEGLIGALLRRADQGHPGPPEWVPMHALIRQELDLLAVEGSLPSTVAVALHLEASRDLVFGVVQDFGEILDHLVEHAAGAPATRRIILRTWGGDGLFRLEVEDDGGPLPPEVLAGAFEPFTELRAPSESSGRHPGEGLPACAQLIRTYRGTLELANTPSGTLFRLGLPFE